MDVAYIIVVLMMMSPLGSATLESYLGWPRIHFSGKFIADVSTVNNIRCNFYNEKFTATNLMKGYPRLAYDPKTKVYTEPTSSWNPDGSGHFYFDDAKVTSFCRRGSPCSTDEPIVGLKVFETSPAVYVDLDVDWQLVSSVLFGLEINIDGVLKGRFAESEVMIPKTRSGTTAGVHKSFLTEVEWFNRGYSSEYSSANKLSISFTFDMFAKDKRSGRFTATIGPTSSMDPLSVPGYRAMSPSSGEMNLPWSSLAIAPFQYDSELKLLVIDLSLSIPADKQGHFDQSSLGDLDLYLIKEMDSCSRDEGSCSSSMTALELTTGGAISKLIGNDDVWYRTFGGVVEVDLSGLEECDRSFISSNRLALKQTPNVGVAAYVFMELPYGIRVGMMGRTTAHLNVDEMFGYTVFASSFGVPLERASLRLDIQREAVADDDCGWEDNICSRKLSTPPSLYIKRRGSILLGLYEFTIIPRRNPGNPRGCGLDGQIYPLMITLLYGNLTFKDGQLALPQVSKRSTLSNVQQDTLYLSVSSPAMAIFSDIAIPINPTWQDVKDIFQLYHNLFPVMWKNNIVDLGSYKGVKNSQSSIQYFMNLPQSNAKYMPVTRDLSRSKINMINMWFEGGTKQFPSDNIVPSCGKLLIENLKNLGKLQSLLHRAITLELSTIPTYFTAWLSLKTEYGKNLQIAGIFNSIFIQEMFHLGLSSNILNAIGGKMELTTIRNIPVYPTSLGFGSFYDISPEMMATIEPMSIGQVSETFAAIEYPAIERQQEIFQEIACIILIEIRGDDSARREGGITQRILSPQISRFLDEFLQRDVCDLHVRGSRRNKWNKLLELVTNGLNALANTSISTIGGFYAEVALRLSLLESCNQLASRTLFDNSTKQSQVELGNNVFPVYNLLTALEAIISIVYQGEGGSECSPYVFPDSKELSHFYRFQEIVYGRKLIQIDAKVPIYTDVCLNISKHCQGSDDTMGGQKFCYLGDAIPFYKEGVWPIVSSPQPDYYVKGSKADILNDRFNTIYSNLLRCLQDTFSGKPDHLTICISDMHDLAIAGKRLVRTKILEGKFAGKNVAPTWSYIRKPTERAGLPVLMGD